MKTFFGGTFIEKQKLEEAGIFHPIKLEYYKNIYDNFLYTSNKAKFGISIVKTEYFENDFKVEEKEIKYITNDENEENRILKIFKENQVTPINSEEVMLDLMRNRICPKQNYEIK